MKNSCLFQLNKMLNALPFVLHVKHSFHHFAQQKDVHSLLQFTMTSISFTHLTPMLHFMEHFNMHISLFEKIICAPESCPILQDISSKHHQLLSPFGIFIYNQRSINIYLSIRFLDAYSLIRGLPGNMVFNFQHLFYSVSDSPQTDKSSCKI